MALPEGESPPTTDSEATSSDGEPPYFHRRRPAPARKGVGAVALAIVALAEADVFPQAECLKTVYDALEYCRDRAHFAEEACDALRLAEARRELGMTAPPPIHRDFDGDRSKDPHWIRLVDDFWDRRDDAAADGAAAKAKNFVESRSEPFGDRNGWLLAGLTRHRAVRRARAMERDASAARAASARPSGKTSGFVKRTTPG